MVLTIKSSTQMVIASGIQMRRPVMRYFFIGFRSGERTQSRSGLYEPAPLPAASDFDSVLPSVLPSVLLSVLLSAFAADFPSGLDSDFASDFVSPLLSVFAAGFGFLKSVAYQPEPFSWNPAAVSILENVFFPHSGQTVFTGSVTFCRYSFWNAQDEQRYS